MNNEPKDLVNDITEQASQPHSVTGDSSTTVQQPIGDMIKADQYAKASAARRGLPFRRVGLRPGNNADIDGRGGNY